MNVKILSVLLCAYSLFLSRIFAQNNVQESFSFTDDTGDTLCVKKQPCVACLQRSLAQIWEKSGGKMAVCTSDVDVAYTKDVAIAGSMMRPNLEVIIAHGVDFVLLSKNIAGHIVLKQQLKQLGIQAAAFEINTFNDYERVMRVCCTITEREDLFLKNVLEPKQNIRNIIKETRNNATKKILLLRYGGTRFKAKSSNSLAGSILHDLHTDNIADSNKRLLEDLSVEAVASANVDFIFIVNMTEENLKDASLIARLKQLPLWAKINAVESGRIFVLPQELFLYKPCEKWDIAYKYLAQILYKLD